MASTTNRSRNFFIFFLGIVISLFLWFVLWTNYPDSSYIPLVFLLFILALLLAQRIQRRPEEKISWLVIITVLVLNIWFISQAYRWEKLLNGLGATESLIPDTSSTLQYVKALVKIVVVDGTALLGWLYFRNGRIGEKTSREKA